MNRYNKLLNTITKHAEENHCMAIKLKYNDNLFYGIHVSHPIHKAYVKEFTELNYNTIRKIIKRNYRTIENLNQLKTYLIEDNAIKEDLLWNY
jgi:hypothetical protein